MNSNQPEDIKFLRVQQVDLQLPSAACIRLRNMCLVKFLKQAVAEKSPDIRRFMATKEKKDD